MEYTFTIAKRSDTPEILKLHKSTAGMPACTWRPAGFNREFVEAAVNNDLLYKVIDKNHNLLAAVVIAGTGEGSTLLPKAAGMCSLIMLGPADAGGGEDIAALLLRKAAGTARRKAYSAVRLLVPKDKAAMCRLCGEHGFVCCGAVSVDGSEYGCYELIL